MQQRKFLFDLSFDAPEHDPQSVQPPIAAPAPDPAEREAALAEARSEGFEAGLAEGLMQGEQSVAARNAAALDTISERLAALVGEAEAARNEQACDAARLALSIARRMMPAFSRSAGFAEIEAVVTQCVRRVLDEPRLVLRVAEDTFDAARGRIEPLAREAGFAGRVIILADAQLGPADCRIEWADGGTERDSGRLWREIDAAVSRALAALEPQPAANAA